MSSYVIFTIVLIVLIDNATSESNIKIVIDNSRPYQASFRLMGLEAGNDAEYRLRIRANYNDGKRNVTGHNIKATDTLVIDNILPGSHNMASIKVQDQLISQPFLGKPVAPKNVRAQCASDHIYVSYDRPSGYFDRIVFDISSPANGVAFKEETRSRRGYNITNLISCSAYKIDIKSSAGEELMDNNFSDVISIDVNTDCTTN